MDNYISTTHCLSTTAIAARCGFSRDSIVIWTKRLGIEPVKVFDKRLYTEEQYALLRDYAERRKAAQRAAAAERVTTP